MRHFRIFASSLAMVLLLAVPAQAAGHEPTNWADLAYRFITLAIVVLVIYKFAGKSIAQALTGRRTGIAAELDDLAVRKDQARSDLADVEKRIADLDRERASILSDYEARGQALQAEIVARAEQEAARIVNQARQTARNEMDNALEAMRGRIAEEIASAAAASIAKSLTAKDHDRLIASALASAEVPAQEGSAVTNSVVARRYAQALFDLAAADGQEALDAAGKDLNAMAAQAHDSPDLARLFGDPVFTPEEKHRVIAALAERLGLSATVRDFCNLLADKKRLSILDQIAAEYQTLLDASQGVLRGELVSAVPLDEAKRDDVRGKLAQKAGKSLALDFTVDETLLGGIVLKVGGSVMDASLRTQLSLLKDTIKRGE